MSEAPRYPRREHRGLSATHPAVLAAARREGMDADTYVLLRTTEHSWPADAAQGKSGIC